MIIGKGNLNRWVVAQWSKLPGRYVAAYLTWTTIMHLTRCAKPSAENNIVSFPEDDRFFVLGITNFHDIANRSICDRGLTNVAVILTILIRHHCPHSPFNVLVKIIKLLLQTFLNPLRMKQ